MNDHAVRLPEASVAYRRLLIALAILWLVLLLPAYPPALHLDAFLHFPVELPLLVLLLIPWRGGIARVGCLLVVVLAALLVLLRSANLGSHLAFGRSFNPLLEMHLIGDGWSLASGSIGLSKALVTAAAVMLLLFGLCLLMYRGLRVIGELDVDSRRGIALVALVLTLCGSAALAMQTTLKRDFRVSLGVPAEITGRFAAMRRSIADLAAFENALDSDPLSAGPSPRFDVLAGMDVLVIFVESYGRSFIESPHFADAAQERLHTLGVSLQNAGLTARSGWLRSSIIGGRSWLAHATFMSGLRITNQAQFDRLIVSERTSLNRLFGNAGWHTVAVMPAIQLAWPEGRWYGAAETHDATALGYRGLPFGWVTMPDQYTLSAFDRFNRSAGDPPVMAEIALISSHAPWTPLARKVPWDAVGDGSIFAGQHRYGQPARAIWRNAGQLRAHFTDAMDYTLEVLGDYLTRNRRAALFIILGDHQPAGIVDSAITTADVPVHLVSTHPAVLEHLDTTHWAAGMLPAASLAVRPMEAMREFIARGFTRDLPRSQ